jgi:tetratricopeptide (TPR) repeat protein
MTEGASEAATGGRGRSAGPAAGLALAVALCYANSLAAPFLLDDPRPGDALVYRTRPLVKASFALNRALSGGETWSYHVLNALVHLACALLLFALLRRTLALAAPRLTTRTQSGLAFVTALLWACHPLQTESVTYLSQRAESLGACAYLACLYAFVRSTESARPLRWQGLALLALVAGFFSKEIIVTAPLALVLYDATFLSSGVRAALVRRKRFWAALAVTSLLCLPPLVGFQMFERQSAMGFYIPQFSALEYLRTQPGVILHYLRLALWPHPLVFDYRWPIVRELGDWLPQTLVVVALLGVALVLLLRRSWIGFALAWFFLVLVPTSSVMPILDPAFEHRTYLSLAGVLVLLVVGGHALCARHASRVRALPAALAAAVALALGAATVQRNHEYRTALALWQTVVERAPTNTRAYSNLASEQKLAGQTEPAMATLERLIALDPSYHTAHNELGRFHLLRGEAGRAIECFQRALAVSLPGSDEAAYRNNLASAYLATGAFAEAEASFRRAVQLAPAKATYHEGLAQALERLERRDEAIAEHEAALALDPELADAQLNLGVLLVAAGRTSEALAALRAAIRLAPSSPEPHAALAAALDARADAAPEELAELLAEALREARRANELAQSRRADVLATLGRALARTGDFAGAATQLESALALPGPRKNAALRARLEGELAAYRRGELP